MQQIDRRSSNTSSRSSSRPLGWLFCALALSFASPAQAEGPVCDHSSEAGIQQMASNLVHLLSETFIRPSWQAANRAGQLQLVPGSIRADYRSYRRGGDVVAEFEFDFQAQDALTGRKFSWQRRFPEAPHSNQPVRAELKYNGTVCPATSTTCFDHEFVCSYSLVFKEEYPGKDSYLVPLNQPNSVALYYGVKVPTILNFEIED